MPGSACVFRSVVCICASVCLQSLCVCVSVLAHVRVCVALCAGSGGA